MCAETIGGREREKQKERFTDVSRVDTKARRIYFRARRDHIVYKIHAAQSRQA